MVARALDLRAAHRVAFEVASPVLPAGTRGTAAPDALLWLVRDPSRATAIEAKRVRVPASAFEGAPIGGLVQLRKGAQQVHAHVRRGFHRAVLVVLIAVDGRARSGGHWLGGELTPDLGRIIAERLDALALEPAAGLLALVVKQPVDRDVRHAGSGAAC